MKFILLGIVFAAANADCQPSNEREECPIDEAWDKPSNIFDNNSPLNYCACKDVASGKFTAICGDGGTCNANGTCTEPVKLGGGEQCMMGSECQSGMCMAGSCMTYR